MERLPQNSERDFLLSRVKPDEKTIDWITPNKGAQTRKDAISWLEKSSESFKKRGIIPAEYILFDRWLEGKGSGFLSPEGIYLVWNS